MTTFVPRHRQRTAAARFTFMSHCHHNIASFGGGTSSALVAAVSVPTLRRDQELGRFTRIRLHI
jgi:hypothetical protein